MKQYIGIIIILMLVAGLVAGCNGGSSTPEKTSVLEGSGISTPSDATSAPTGSDSPTPEGFSETASESTPVVSSDTDVTGETPAENPPAQSIPTSPQQTEPVGSTSSTSTPSAGIIEILVTDAPPGYEITSVKVTVLGVEVHQAVAEQAQDQDRDQDGEGDQNKNKNKDKQKSQGNGKGVAGNDESTPTPDDEPSDESDAVVEDNSDDADGNGSWIQLDIEGTFDLLLVQEVSEVLGTDFLDPGKYTQIRMTVDSVIVEYLHGTSSGTQTAEVPSGKLKFVRPFNIESGQTTSLLFDFIADKSINFTGSGKVIFKPVIKLQVSEPVPTLNITTNSLPNGTVAEFYSTSLEAAGGTTPYAWTWSGTLPGGLNLDATTGVISGTPTAAVDYDFTVQVNDSDSQVDTQALSISISAAVSPLEITTTSLLAGKEGIGYSATLAAAGGTTPYAWTWSGTLPGGLNLDTAGVISGTPTAAGSYDFTVQVDDSDSQVDTQALSISISAAVSPLEITTTSLLAGKEGIGYSATLAAAGGTTPYAWTWSGTLPGGLSLDAATGVISGTPTAAGSYDFTVQVDDNDSQVDTQALNISITE